MSSLCILKMRVPPVAQSGFDEEVAQFRLELRVRKKFRLVDQKQTIPAVERRDDYGNNLRQANAHIMRA
ncbi:MAG: hypothetical protein ACOC8H_01845 [bacterium]